MRAGRLRYRATLLALGDQLQVVELGQRWVDIRTKEGDSPAPAGLRQRSLVEIRSRFSDIFRSGRYLQHGGRLFHLVSPRPVGNGAELVVSAEELAGEPGQYIPQGGGPLCCRVHLTHEAPYRDELGQVTSYMTRAEVAIIEVGRPQEGDQLRVSGVPYVVAHYADESDDGVVRGLWLLPVE